MIKDVTETWQSPKAGNGLYILRGLHEPHRCVVRVGAGGINRGSNGLFHRLTLHGKPWKQKRTCGTHECQPFGVVHAWELANWTPAEIAIGEICLYRAFAVRFLRKTDGLPDKSLFLVSENADLAPLLADARADFEAVERLR